MKSKKVSAVAALLALTCASLASATTTVIHVTGSTAYRAAVVTAEVDVLGKTSVTGTFFNFDSGVAGGGTASGKPKSNLTGANVSVIYGPVTSGNQTVFENSFSGSVLGALELTNKTAIGTFPSHTYYDPNTGTAKSTAITAGSSGSPATGGAGALLVGTPPNFSGYQEETAIAPDVAMSDVFLDTVSKLAALGTNPVQKTVGIVPFVFMVGNGTPSGVTDITPQQFGQLYCAGRVPLSFFDGVTTDEATIVYALGRDLDSGTRSTAFAETGFGVATPPIQYYPLNSGSFVVGLTDPTTGVSASGPITSLEEVPAETIDGIFEDVGKAGYASGGDLAGGLSASNTSGGILLGYLGLNDAAKAQASSNSFPGRVIAYNGYTLTLDPTNTNGYFVDTTSAPKIQEGQYTFWGYEHLYYLTASTTITSLVNTLNGGDDKVSAGGPNGVTLGAMDVGRTDDGAAVTAGYTY